MGWRGFWYNWGMVSLTASWDDEDLPRKIREHFLVNFAEVRQFLQHLKNLRNREKPPVRDANSTVFSIGIDNLPRQFISQDSFEYLLGAYEEFRRFSNAVPYPDPTGEEAGIYLVRRLIVILAGRFITRSIYPLLLDRRFNRDAPVTVDVSDLFAVNERMEEELSALPQLPIQIRMMEVLLGPGVRDQFAKATELLQMTSRIFFNMMLAAYRLPEISACSLAFDAVLMCIVQCKDNAAEQVSEYRLRLQDMYAAITSFGDRREQTDFNRILEAATSSNAEVLWQLEGIKKLVEQCMHPRFCGVPKEAFENRDAAVDYIKKIAKRVRDNVEGRTTLLKAAVYIRCDARQGDDFYAECKACRELQNHWGWSDSTFDQYAKPASAVTHSKVAGRRRKAKRWQAKKRRIKSDLAVMSRNHFDPTLTNKNGEVPMLETD